MKGMLERGKTYLICIGIGVLLILFMIWSGPWSRGQTEQGVASSTPNMRIQLPEPKPLALTIPRDPVLRVAKTEVARTFRTELATATTLDEACTVKVYGKIVVDLERRLSRDVQRARLEERIDDYFRRGGPESEYYAEEWLALSTRRSKETLELLRRYVEDAEARLMAGEEPTELRAIVREARWRFETAKDDALSLAAALQIIKNLVWQNQGRGRPPGKTGLFESVEATDGEVFVSAGAEAPSREAEPPKSPWSGHAQRLLRKWQ
jgi:hypothetical protein